MNVFDPHLVGLGVSPVVARPTAVSPVVATPRKDDFGVSPVVAKGLGEDPCCAECAQTGDRCGSSQPVSFPGTAAFPVGFGQSDSSSNTMTVATDAVTAWAVPLTIGLVSVAAGFGLAYALSKR
jgi:hypothetical protein